MGPAISSRFRDASRILRLLRTAECKRRSNLPIPISILANLRLINVDIGTRRVVQRQKVRITTATCGGIMNKPKVLESQSERMSCCCPRQAGLPVGCWSTNIFYQVRAVFSSSRSITRALLLAICAAPEPTATLSRNAQFLGCPSRCVGGESDLGW